jgi:endo-1,4-beta-xylanase
MAPAPAFDDDWERLDDASIGKVTEFQGVGGLSIPAYIRRPQGAGPFPVVVMLHGGRYGKAATYGLGRSLRAPVSDIVKAGFAVYSIDYRPDEKITLAPIEIDDTIEAVKTVRRLPFIDATRVGLMGGSHGANVSARVLARIETKGAVLCAPAALDLIEVKKAAARGEPVVPILNRLVSEMEQKFGAKAEEIEKDPARFGYSSGLTEARDARCPILIINGRNDDNSPVSIIDLYVERLRAAGKEVQTYLPDHGPHGFYFGRPDIPESKEATRLAVGFFSRRFGQGQAQPAPEAKAEAKFQYGAMAWVDPDPTEPAGTHYKTFHSKTIDADASYLIYLPPGYETAADTRYPVLYQLHGSGGTPARGAGEVARRVDRLMRAGKLAPFVIVFPNGLRGATMYCDARDGAYPVESVIIKDLIPHVDATYRTLAARESRAVEGFSMGGFGAAHFGFKYPELFGVVSIEAPALLGPGLKAPLPTRAWSKLFPSAMGSDMEYFHANDPFALVPRNADVLRDRTVIRIVTHVEDENWLAPRCEELHQVLMENRIPHQFLFLSNVKSHNRAQVLDTMGDAGWVFFSSAFEALKSKALPGSR